MKKKFNIKQTDSGNFYTWVSEGSGKYRKKSKITGSTPNEVIIKATKWLKHIDEEKDTPYTVKQAMLQFIDSRSRVLEPTTICNYRELVRNKLQYNSRQRISKSQSIWMHTVSVINPSRMLMDS